MRTQAALAAALGVSSATVSNAFNRPDQLSPELRERILRAARDAGYVGPDPTARALARGKRGTIGVVFTERLTYAFSDPAAVLFPEGLARACEDADTGLLLVPVSAGASSGSHNIHRAAVDALALYSLPDDDPAVAAALAQEIAVVMIDQPETPGAAFIGIDDRAAGRAALNHLLELGHRDITVIAYRLTPERRRGELSQGTAARRLVPYDSAASQGLWRCPEAVRPWLGNSRFYESDSNDPAGGAATAAEIFVADSRPTAILTDSDQLALGVIQAAVSAGIQVPEDLSIVGSDDIPAASVVTPALTTIKQPLISKGEEAAGFFSVRAPLKTS